MKKKGSISYAKYGYIFSIPFVVAYLIFAFYPTLYTIIIGFTNLRGVGKTTFQFLPLAKLFDNYRAVLTAPTFKIALGNTVKMWVLNFIPQLILALLLAAWFTNRRIKVPGEGAFKVLFYMPNIITAATVAILFNALLGYPMGPLNDLLLRFNFISKPIDFLIYKKVAQGFVIFIQTWMWYGYTMIIMISAILGISPDIFEAADIDGANGFQVFFKITLPSIRTILLFTLVQSLIGGLNMFDIPQLFVQNSGPDNATLTTNVYIYKLAFSGGYLYNRASAASMFMFVIIAVCSALLFFIMRDKDEAAMKKAAKLQRKEMKKAEKARLAAAGSAVKGGK
ncbi:MAG: sugar ABC transporter permease [Treponema sp.]|nr:sugar ABC transporter permease [Treponema sp.]